MLAAPASRSCSARAIRWASTQWCGVVPVSSRKRRAKVRSLIAVVVKRYGVEPPGYEDVLPGHPTLGDVDSPEALAEYQAAKRAYKAQLRAAAG